jgi:hypothetical protein
MVALNLYFKSLIEKTNFNSALIYSFTWSWNRFQRRTELSFRLQNRENLPTAINSLNFLEHETKCIYISWRSGTYLGIYYKKKKFENVEVTEINKISCCWI